MNCKGYQRRPHKGKQASERRPELCALCDARRVAKNARAAVDDKSDLYFINCVRECLGLLPILANGPLTDG